MKIYTTAWQFMIQYVKVVEDLLHTFGIENKHRFFFIRGPYPVYLLSSLYLMSYFYFFMDEDFQQSWGNFYYGTFMAKIMVTVILAFMEPCWVIKDEAINEFISNYREDLQRNRCPRDEMFVQFRAFHCHNCNRCVARRERHSFLVLRCIGANNFPIYYLHCWLEMINSLVIFYAICLTFTQRLDNDLILFLFYVMIIITYLWMFTKKLIVHSISVFTGSSLWERENEGKLHYRQRHQVTTMQIMRGAKLEIYNPFNKGIILNFCDFLAPLFNFHKREKSAKIPTG